MNKAQHYAQHLTAKPRARHRVESALLFLTGAGIGSLLTNLIILWRWA